LNKYKIEVKIKERSFVARLAALKLGTTNVAIVFGRTIFLYGATKQELLNDENWLKHELMHVFQYEREGFIRFLFKYVWLSIRYGYKRNPLELEAELAVNDKEILNQVVIL
jgi:hypothetical protein